MTRQQLLDRFGVTVTMAMRALWTCTFVACARSSVTAAIALRRWSASVTVLSVVPRVRQRLQDNSMTRVPVLILAAIAAALLLGAVVFAVPLWVTVAGLTLVIAALIGLATRGDSHSTPLKT